MILALVLFGGAGTFQWPAGWLLWGFFVALQVSIDVILARHSPDLVAERSRAVEGHKTWDIPYALAMAFGPFLAVLAAALSYRAGALPAPVLWRQLSALFLMAAGSAFTLWATLVNRFFSGVVRIQTDRGHKVVSTGPYSWVRHPGYLGAIVYFAGIPLYFWSLWALAVVLMILVSAVVRTRREDETLQQELPGYAEYALRTRFRLLPGIW